MNIKLLVSLMLGALPLTMMAQDDDMYFVPSKKSAGSSTVRTVRPAPTFYSGSNRSVDEYNRRGGSYYQVVPTDTIGNDIINFNGELGVYPDSAMMDDYALTRNMSRWDGYEPAGSYLEGYRDGRNASWGWHSPWYYSSYYPWYTGWYDPWYYGYYGWYGGWYDPWYYDYYWYHPYWYGYYPHYYYGGGGIAHFSGTRGTAHHGGISYNTPRGISNGRTTSYSGGTFGGRSLGTGSRYGSSFGGSRSSSAGTTRTYGTSSTRRTSSNSYGNFGGSRSSSSSSSGSRSYTPTYSSSSSSSTSSGGFSGSSSSTSSGGGSFGGSRSSGGGSFGGSRSSGGGGGGGHFGGRR